MLGLDTRYNEGSYNYSLPILVPSEIGIGYFNTPHHFNSFVLHSLERGAQGFGVYCYGEVRKELPDSLNARLTLTNMFKAIKENEDIIYAGLPGYGYMRCIPEEGHSFHASHLQVDSKETLALIYHSPFAADQDSGHAQPADLTIQLECMASGKYQLDIHRLGKNTIQKTVKMQKAKLQSITIESLTPEDILFIRIKQKE